METETEVANNLSINDKFEITNVIHLFFHHLDSGNAEGVADLFLEEGILSVPYRKMHAVGREAIKNWANGVRTKLPNTTHWEANVVIEDDPVKKDTAKNISYWRSTNGNDTTSYGKHNDVFKKVKGKWKFETRKVIFFWTKDTGHLDAQ